MCGPRWLHKIRNPAREAVDTVIFASGSEVWVAIDAAKELVAERGNIRVVSPALLGAIL